MKLFSLCPFIPALLAASVLSGCAGALSKPDMGHMPVAAGTSAQHKNMPGGGCACCGMHKGGMSHAMKQGESSPQHDAMCSPGKNDNGKSGCGGCGSCDMSKMSSGGCSCCGMGKQ